jgi:hypothetical protein
MQFSQPRDNGLWSQANFCPFHEVGTITNQTSVPLDNTIWPKTTIPVKFTATAAVSEAASHSATTHNISGASISNDNSTVFFGETCPSIRSLIKRYTMVTANTYNNDPRDSNYEMCMRIVPMVPPPVLDKVVRRNSFLNYLAPMFLIGRGSTRYKLQSMSKGNRERDTHPETRGTSQQFVERFSNRHPVPTAGYDVLDIGTLSSAELRAALPSGIPGAAYTDNELMSTLEVQIPFYSNTRFMLSAFVLGMGNETGKETLNVNPTMTQSLGLKHVFTGFDAHANPAIQWFAAGDDFSLHFFTGVPGMFFY